MGRVLIASSLACVTLVGVLGFALVGARTLERFEASLVRAQYNHVLARTVETIEQDLRAGHSLAELTTMAALERAKERAPGVLAVDVISERGITEASTDRGALGEPVPQRWADAIATARGEAWNTGSFRSVTMAMKLRNAETDSVGWAALVIDWRALPAPLTEARPILTRSVAVIALAVFLAAITGYVFAVRANRSLWSDLAGEPPPPDRRDSLDDANVRAVEATRLIAGRLSLATQDLKRLDAEV